MTAPFHSRVDGAFTRRAPRAPPGRFSGRGLLGRGLRRGGSIGGGEGARRTARGGASGRRSGRSGRRRRRRPAASRWGWRGSPASASPGRRAYLRTIWPAASSASRASGSAVRNLPSPWATGSSIGSSNDTNGERPGRGRRVDPAGLEPARVVVGERGRAGRVAAGQQAAAGPGPGSRCRCPGSVRRGRGTAAGRRRGRAPGAWPRSGRRPGRRRRRIRRGASGSGTGRARAAPPGAGRRARSRRGRRPVPRRRPSPRRSWSPGPGARSTRGVGTWWSCCCVETPSMSQ